MSSFRGLFAGLTTIDIQYFVPSFPIADTKINSTIPPEILVGGPATNAAVAFAHLNGTAFLASATGENPFSAYIQKDFQATNIEHFDLAKNLSFSPVISSIVTSEENGDRNIFTHHPPNITSVITPSELLKRIHPNILLTDGFYPEFSLECVELAHKKNIPVVLDCGSWKPQHESLLNFADYVICSNDFRPPKCLNSDDVFDFLRDKNVQNIAITRGNKNILFNDKLLCGEIEINSVAVKDTLGAGDFFHGAFCFYWLQSNNFQMALRSASKLASFTCQFKGTRNWLNFSD